MVWKGGVAVGIQVVPEWMAELEEELNANLMDILDDCEKRAKVDYSGRRTGRL